MPRARAQNTRRMHPDHPSVPPHHPAWSGCGMQRRNLWHCEACSRCMSPGLAWRISWIPWREPSLHGMLRAQMATHLAPRRRLSQAFSAGRGPERSQSSGQALGQMVHVKVNNPWGLNSTTQCTPPAPRTAWRSGATCNGPFESGWESLLLCHRCVSDGSSSSDRRSVESSCALHSPSDPESQCLTLSPLRHLSRV